MPRISHLTRSHLRGEDYEVGGKKAKDMKRPAAVSVLKKPAVGKTAAVKVAKTEKKKDNKSEKKKDKTAMKRKP